MLESRGRTLTLAPLPIKPPEIEQAMEGQRVRRAFQGQRALHHFFSPAFSGNMKGSKCSYLLSGNDIEEGTFPPWRGGNRPGARMGLGIIRNY